MKKNLAIMVSLIFVLVLTGCNNDALQVRNAIKNQATIENMEMRSKYQLKTNLSEEVLGPEGSLVLALLESGIVIDSRISEREDFSSLVSVIGENQLREKGFWDFEAKPGFEFIGKDDGYYLKTTADGKYLLINLRELAEYEDGDQGVKVYERNKEFQKSINELTLELLPIYLKQYDYDLKQVSNLGYQTINTPEGVISVKQVKIDLTEEDIKNILIYTLDNLAYSPIAEEYVFGIHRLMVQYEQESAKLQTAEEMYKEFQQTLLEVKGAFEDSSLEELKEELGLSLNLSYIYSIDDKGFIRKTDTLFRFSAKDINAPDGIFNLELIGENIYWDINKAKEITVPEEKETVNLINIIEDNQLIEEWDQKSPMYPIVSLAAELGTENTTMLLKVDEGTAFVNGELIELEAAPYVKNGRTMVPVRQVADALGAEVNWNPQTKVTTFKTKDKTVMVTIGSNMATVNSKQIVLEQSPEVVKGRTTIPLRLVSEGLGAQVEWLPETKEIWIRK